MANVNKKVILDMNEIDLEEMEDHLILSEEVPSLDFLDNEWAICSKNAEFYCTSHDEYLCQKWRNKEHIACINKKAIENVREFKQEVEFDITYMHKEIKRFWTICQVIGINSFNNWIYEMSESYEKWIDSLREIAEQDGGNLIDKVLNNTNLK